jgi:TetR/AcrR family transcriptional regulator, cholesterol catabolism regulator
MSTKRRPASREAVLDVVVELLETHGYDNVHVRDVAQRASVSSKTIYKIYESRDDLIVSALERWMATSIYANFEMPLPDDSLRDSLLRTLRAVFGPWEQHPRMLEAWYRTFSGTDHRRLSVQGVAEAHRVGDPLLEREDPALVRDIEDILSNLVVGLISRFVHGELAITDILPVLERALVRLTAEVPADGLLGATSLLAATATTAVRHRTGRT